MGTSETHGRSTDSKRLDGNTATHYGADNPASLITLAYMGQTIPESNAPEVLPFRGLLVGIR